VFYWHSSSWNALEPLLEEIESLSQRIAAYDRQIEQIAKKEYPEVSLLQQVKGVGTLIALTYLLTLEDPHRFRRSRDVGCYLGLRPGRRNSGSSQPHISKEGDSYLRTLMVRGAHYILGPFGEDSDLRRWGLQLAERGGRMPRNERSLRWRESWPCGFTSCGSTARFMNRCAIIRLRWMP
jgi:transposase